MDKYKKYYGILAFVAIIGLVIYYGYNSIMPKIEEKASMESTITEKESALKQKETELATVKKKIKDLKNANLNSQKKLYTPTESDLGNDTLFFTLYNDVIEMIHSNSVKIKDIRYEYYPAGDPFVEFSKELYFVCDIDLKLVANYVNLGKLVQDLYQYPYYIKINELTVSPYPKDKKVLLTNLSLRLYAHTAPQEEEPIQ